MAIDVGLSLLLLATAVCPAPLVQPLMRRGRLPEPIDVATAKIYLSELTVAEEVNSPAYEREYFKHWIKISGDCDTRDFVLIRDGFNVTISNHCSVTSGVWYSDYDGVTWTSASDVDIDHVVPLVRSIQQWNPITGH